MALPLPLLRPPDHLARGGADLSFRYGTFLGVSPTPEAVFLEIPTDPAYAEIQALVSENARNPGTTAMAAGQLIRSVVGSVFDPDSSSAPFTFAGTPPCPRCTSTQIELPYETKTPWPGTISQATHNHLGHPDLRREGHSRGPRPEQPASLSADRPPVARHTWRLENPH